MEMYLSGKTLKNEIVNNSVIDGFCDKNFGISSYDLRIQKIIKSKTHEELDKYELKSGEVVFISTIENIDLPDDMIAMITPRNSCIRMGLDIAAPVYQPGHHTKIFVRVENMSDNEIMLSAEDSICSCMFYQLKEKVDKPYNGTFSREFNYTDSGEFHDIKIPKAIEIEKKIESIENAEKGIYSTVITLMTIFIGIFSLINLNVNFLSKEVDVAYLLVYNLTSLGSIFALVSLISSVLSFLSRNQKKWMSTAIIGGVAFIFFIAAFAIYYFAK